MSRATSAATLTVIVPSLVGATSRVYDVPEPCKLDVEPPVTTISPIASPVTDAPNVTVISIGSAFVGSDCVAPIVVVGPVVSITNGCADEASDTLPTGSACVAVREWVPSCKVEVVIDHTLLDTVSVPTIPSRLDDSVTTSPSTQVPVMVGVSLLVVVVGASIYGAEDAV